MGNSLGKGWLAPAELPFGGERARVGPQQEALSPVRVRGQALPAVESPSLQAPWRLAPEATSFGAAPERHEDSVAFQSSMGTV